MKVFFGSDAGSRGKKRRRDVKATPEVEGSDIDQGSGAPASAMIEDFCKLSQEAGRSLHDHYYCMTFEGGIREQLAIAVLTPGNEDKDKEEDRSETSLSGHGDDLSDEGEKGRDDSVATLGAASSQPQTDAEDAVQRAGSGGSGPVEGSLAGKQGSTEPKQPRARLHSAGEGPGVDVGTGADGKDDSNSQDSEFPLVPQYEDTAYGCVAVLVRQLSGSGDVVVPKNVDASVMDAFRVAVFWARLNEAAIHKAFSDAPRCRPAYEPDMDMHLMLPYFKMTLEGPSVGAAFVLGVVQCMTGCQLVTRVGISGQMTLTDGIYTIGSVDTKLRPVERGILTKLVVPTMNMDESVVKAAIAAGQVSCVTSVQDLLQEMVVGGRWLELNEANVDVGVVLAATFGDNVTEPPGSHLLELAVADGTGKLFICGTDQHDHIRSDINGSRVWVADEAPRIIQMLKEFLPEVKLAIDVAKLVRTADHPLVRQQQGQAQGGRLDLMLHVLSWRRMDTFQLGAALCVGMLALACGLKVPRTTVVVGLASPRGVMMAKDEMCDIDVDSFIEWEKKILVLPLACLKLLLSRSASAEHEYVVLEESPSEMRAVYAGRLKLVGVTLIDQALRNIFDPAQQQQEFRLVETD